LNRRFILAYLATLVLLAYPLGFVALWLQVANEYGFDYATSRYAVSLIPPSTVASKIVFITVSSIVTYPFVLLVFSIWRNQLHSQRRRVYPWVRHALGAVLVVMLLLVAVAYLWNPSSDAYAFLRLCAGIAISILLGGFVGGAVYYRVGKV
jgi:hypothetical protein